MALPLFSTCVCAQSPAVYNLSAIHFIGLDRYTTEQGIAASGLRVGGSITLADLQAAAERLSRTGAFDSVSFQYSSNGNDLTAQFGVTETKDVLPCVFDNFVWFTDADLDRTLRQRVTFYTGESPVRGDSVAQIRGALQDLLRSNGIPGKVAEMPSSLLGQKFSALLFYVDGISLPIKDITFSGESAISDKQLSDAAAGLRNQNFSNTNVALYASATLLPLYYRRGYLRSQFGRAGVSVIDPNSKGPVTDVSVTVSVVEGNQYFWSGVSWSGNQALSASDLGKVLEMNPKDVANQEKIDTGFANARKTYESQGFINVRITPTRNLDDAVRLASYSVRIDEGDQFHMGKVYFDGLPERVAAALLKKWKLKPGDVYDESYPADFLKDVAPKELAQQGGGFHVTSMKQDADANRLIVDVHFGFH